MASPDSGQFRLRFCGEAPGSTRFIHHNEEIMTKLFAAIMAALFSIASVSPAFASEKKEEKKAEKKAEKK
jgi:hypothetical protein